MYFGNKTKILFYSFVFIVVFGVVIVPKIFFAASNCGVGSQYDAETGILSLTCINSTDVHTLSCNSKYRPSKIMLTVNGLTDSLVCTNNTEGRAPIVDLRINLSNSPDPVVAPGSFLLSWSTLNEPSSCTASNDWEGDRAVNGGTERFSSLTDGVYTYTLTCSNEFGSGSDSVSIIIGQRPSLLSANTPNCIISANKNTCNSEVGWEIKNPIAPSVTQNFVEFSKSALSNSVVRVLEYGVGNSRNTIRFNDSGALLGVRTPAATCVAGTSWNGSVCAPECNDGEDNDNDGLVDFKLNNTGDPGCRDFNDNDELNELPTLFVSPRTVVEGEQVKLTWDLKGNTNCTLTANEQPVSVDIESVTSHMATVTVRTTYTLMCGLNSKTVVVEVIPRGFES